MAMILPAAAVITIVLDIWHAYFNRYPFYVEESVLFASIWVLFVPGWWLVKRWRLTWRFIPLLAAGHLLLYACLVWSVSACFLDHRYDVWGTIAYAVPTYALLLLLLYGVPFLLERGEAVEIIPIAPVPIDTITIQQGGTYIPLPVKDITYIESAKPYIRLHVQGRAYLHNTSLQQMMEVLEVAGFVQVHRSTIVQVKHVVQYVSRLNGDYDVYLQDGTLLRLSRTYVARFKEKMKGV
ncbi:LytTr DNA-binding domain-containing protein [Chitinophaga skermanii]|uniref:LytTr DNA-binding domain-containing protein n=1 Tax=Chitinophaga skermanii TaxID=331697 RepID=A0A327QLL4_9BACT|nr:LytTR family DNA-binding domain-containing protein [Chitinophaga skermanii]RAJ05200.1 LytTr DNA-binding domain-containing protein [Chitinophaga skermanii]